MKKGTILIRYAEPDDVSRMFQISVQAHRQLYAELIPNSQYAAFMDRYTLTKKNEDRYKNFMLKRIRGSSWYVWVAVDGISGEIAGYTLAYVARSDFMKKRGLFVHPDYQGRGIGSQLFDCSLSVLQSGTIQLSVISTNEKAMRIYEKAGFYSVGNDPKPFFGARRSLMKYHKR